MAGGDQRECRDKIKRQGVKDGGYMNTNKLRKFYFLNFFLYKIFSHDIQLGFSHLNLS